MFHKHESPEEEPLIAPAECVVRPGIMQRAWLVELAGALSRLPSASTWGSGIEDLWNIDIAIAQAASPGGMMILTAEEDGAEAGSGAASEPEIPEELRPPKDREGLATACEEAGFRTIQWLVAALDTRDGDLVPGEANADVLARLGLRALGDTTVGYAFADFEKDIVRDAQWGSDVRERLDRIALRIIELPGLGWWSEEFTPENFGYHLTYDVEDYGRPVVVRPGEKIAPATLREFGSGRFSKERRALEAGLKAAQKALPERPMLLGATWEAGSHSPVRTLHSYRTTRPEWLAPTPAELGDGPHVNEELAEEREEAASCVCTQQFLGDDAGDLPLNRLTRQALPKRPWRIATIHNASQWVDLVLAYPMALVTSGAYDEPQEWGGTARGPWLTLDWQKASEEIDGVYLSVLGGLDAAYVPQAVAVDGQEMWTMMTGWVPGSVIWINDPMGEKE